MISRHQRRLLYISLTGLAALCALIILAIELIAKEKPLEMKPLDSEILTVTSNNGQPSRLLIRKGFTVSYNDELKIPNWVAWELTPAKTRGQEPRYNKFQTDPHVAASATPGDYKYSGYDRGHMAPAADMKWDHEAMVQCFYMTNIAPQKNALNSGPWNKLEEKCRTWTTMDSTLYIVCGPVLADPPIEKIGASRVAVPQRFFKVILAPYSSRGPMGIGFILNNGPNQGGLQPAAVSIDEVEAVTGLDFFSALPDSIENVVEKMSNFNKWNSRPRR